MQVGHVAGEELDVGPAYAGPLDIHHHLAGCGRRRLNLGHGELARAGEYATLSCSALPYLGGGVSGSRPRTGRCDPNVIVQTAREGKDMARTAVITGGASGIGRASADRLAQDGITVITLDRSADADVVADVTDAAAVGTALGGISPVDILVNSAGIVGPNKPLWEVSDEEWAATFAVNVTGTFHMCRAVVPGMRDRGWGRIVNLASMAGKDSATPGSRLIRPPRPR